VLTGRIRSTETRTVELEGVSLDDVRAQAAAACPPGFEIISAPVRMQKSSTALKATATYRSTESRDIQAPDMPALRAAVPDGWTLLSVRRVQ